MTTQTTTGPDYLILSAFDQPIARPRTRFFYQVSLLLVTVAMVLLPLVYLALVCGAAWGVYYHATHHWSSIMGFGGTRGGRLVIIKFIIWFVPLFTGCVVVFFMLKPLLARRQKRAQPLALNPADNPLLYAFIEKICDVVGAPSPTRIDLNCDLNASAGFRRGFFSMFGNDLVLTLGLPLVANLNAREFAGVVAHEFGHFTQSFGMRMSYIIRSVIFWFGRVAYERDAWDETLESWSEDVEDGYVALIVWTAQIGVWFSRTILRVLMFLGIFIAGFLLRQMEYDADAYEIKLVGSQTFETTQRKFATLGAAVNVTYKQIRNVWKKSEALPDNISELIRQYHEQLPPAVLKKIDDTLGLEPTSFFSTHPSAADRIRQARLADEPGIFHDERPATELFASFEHPARFVTLLHYTDDLDIPVKAEKLLRVQPSQKKSEAASTQSASAHSTSNEYLLGIERMLLPIKLEPPSPSANYEQHATELEQLASSLKNLTEQLASIATQFTDASGRMFKARAALRSLEARHPIKLESFGLADGNIESVRAVESEASATRDSLRHSVHEVAAALNRRMQLALSLKLVDENDTEASKRIHELVAALNQSEKEFRKKEEVLEAILVLDLIASQKNDGGEPHSLSRAIATQSQVINSLTASDDTPAPDEPVNSGLRLSKKQSHVSIGDLNELRRSSLEWMMDYHRKLGDLTEIARSAESIS
ncbi:MAG: M48 family metalloprotease [Verrucomicrobia bacterium]|nr:M48 family metalloprotease [Verrucomicrobiota bacterium]